MNTLKKICDSIVRSVDGGLKTTDSKFRLKYIEDLCVQYRAVAIRTIFEKTERINNNWLQTFLPDYEKNYQDSEQYVKFLIPTAIPMGTFQNGYSYIGTDCDSKDYNQENFRRLLSLSELTTYVNSRSFNSKKTRVLISDIEGDYIVLKVYGNKNLKKIKTECVFSDPRKVSTYNKDKDFFPLCDEGIVLMKQLLIKSELMTEAQMPGDLKQNNKPENTIPVKQ